jgi:glutamyl-tRNA synthetase
VHGHLGETVDEAVFATAAELVQTRIVVLSDAWGLLKFLFVDEDDFTIDPAAAAKNLGADAAPVLDAALASLEAVAVWNAAALEEALKASLVDGLGLKPRKAFAPVRVGITGSHISPPLYESMELLGRDVSLSRLRSARASIAE